MSGNTSETRCDKCYFLACPCAGHGVCGCVCHAEPTPPEGEADPLSPLLDMSVVEGLSEELRKAKAEGEAVTEQPNRAHFSLSPVEAHETVAGKENLTMKNFVIAFHVCCETKEQAHQWRMSALQILDQNTHALGYKPDETGDLNCHCSGHADEENGEEEIPLIPAPVVSTAAPEVKP